MANASRASGRVRLTIPERHQIEKLLDERGELAAARELRVSRLAALRALAGRPLSPAIAECVRSRLAGGASR